MQYIYDSFSEDDDENLIQYVVNDLKKRTIVFRFHQQTLQSLGLNKNGSFGEIDDSGVESGKREIIFNDKIVWFLNNDELTVSLNFR